MKQFLTLLMIPLTILLTLSGCDFLEGLDLAEPDPELPAAESQPEEPEGSKAVTLILSKELDETRTVLLDAAVQTAAETGYTLSNVVTMGNPELQSRFLALARDAGEQAVLLELADPSAADEAVREAGEMAVIFVDTAPEGNSALSKRAIYVGNPEGSGEAYLRLTGRTAMRAAGNLIEGKSASEETELKLSGHKITVPADGVLDSQRDKSQDEKSPDEKPQGEESQEN